MKIIITKVISGILLLVIALYLLVYTYFTLIDKETKEPKETEVECELNTEEFMERKVFILKPKNISKSKIKILYFHGGSYVSEATQQHWDFIGQIVKDTGATIIMPDYPLTPKYNYKDVFDMIVPLYKELINQVSTSDLIIMGDSAGGGLALSLEERVAQEGLPMPEKTILISPWLDVRLNNPQIEEVQKLDKQLNKEVLKVAGISYAGEDGINSYLVNPIDGDLTKLKNIIIFTGTYDILNPDIKLLKEKAEKVGTQIEVKEYEKAGHNWIIEKNITHEAYQEIIKLIK